MPKKSFDLRVYEAVSQILFGQVATYGQIADLIGAYGCARQGGWSLRRLTLSLKIPWHRVINAKGRISMTINRHDTDWIQGDLLKHKGIVLAMNEK